MTTITIQDDLLVDYADSKGFTPEEDLTEAKAKEAKIEYAREDLKKEVLAKFLRPAEVKIRKEKLDEAEAELATVKTSAEAGIKIE